MTLAGSAAVSVRVVLFGSPHLIVDGVRAPLLAPPRTAPLLAILALRGSVARERLAALLWPDDDDITARANLRRHLHRLTKALPESEMPYVSTEGTTVSWNAPAHCEIDVLAFEEARAAERWEAASRLYGGDLLAGNEEEWVVAERERLREAFVAATLRAASDAAARFDHAEVETLALRLLEHDPWREDALRRLMTARYERADRAGALAAFDAFAQRLHDELGVGPAPETDALAGMIRRERPLHVQRSEAARPARMPFTGRDRDLATITARWEAARAGNGCALAIRGEPGIGKSRLVFEGGTLIAAQGARVLAGGTSAPEARPYQAVVEALRAALAPLLANDSDPPWLAALATLVPEIAAERRALGAPVPLDAARERSRLFDAVGNAFAYLARSRPLAVILEDLHWAGDGTLDLVELLVRRAPGLPLLLVATLRTTEAPRASQRIRRLEADGTCTAIALGPLSREDVHRIAARVHPAAEAAAEELYAQSEGNPLFLTEAIRDFVERPSGARPASDVGKTIGARLDRLDENVRTLLDAAAVCGKGFDLDTLCAAGGWSEARVLDDLDVLLDHGLVRLSTARDRTRYTFAHDLIRATAYDSVEAGRRRILHRRVARALAAQAGTREEDAAPIAAHFDAAGRAQEAAEYYLRAARRASNVYANADVAPLVARALDLERDEDQRFELYAIGEEAARRLGDREAQLHASAAMLTLAEHLNAERLADALHRRIATLRATGRRDEATTAIDRLAAIDDFAAAIERVRSAHTEVAHEEALRLSAAALELAGQRGDPRALAAARIEHAKNCAVGGMTEQTETMIEAALAAARSTGDIALLQETLHAGSGAAFNAELLDLAVSLSEESRTIAVAAGDTVGEAIALLRRGTVALRRDHVLIANAIADFEKAANAFARSGEVHRTADVEVNLGVAYSLIGDWQRAYHASERAIAALRELGDLRRLAIATFNFASSSFELGKLDQADRVCDEALALAHDAGIEPVVASAYGLRGTIAHERGDLERSIAALRTCVEMERTLANAYDRANNVAEFALSLVAANRLDEVPPLLAELDAVPAEQYRKMQWPQTIPYARFRYFEALGDRAAAARELAEAERIRRERAAGLPRADWRATFARSLANRRIVATVESAAPAG